MTNQQFQNWLDNLKKAWLNKNPQGAADLCAEKLIWYETPFRQPYHTNQEILKEWQGILNQKDVSVNFEILCVYNNVGIAKWHAEFTLISTNQKFIYDGIYQVTLNTSGKCIEFREWFNSQEQ